MTTYSYRWESLIFPRGDEGARPTVLGGTYEGARAVAVRESGALVLVEREVPDAVPASSLQGEDGKRAWRAWRLSGRAPGDARLPWADEGEEEWQDMDGGTRERWRQVAAAVTPAPGLAGEHLEQAAQRAWSAWRAGSGLVAWEHLGDELREQWRAAMREAMLA